MKLSSLIVVRPICFFFLLAFTVLLLPSVVLPFWIIRVRRIEQEVNLISHDLSREFLSRIEKAAELLSPVNSSSTNLARLLSSSLDGLNISFPTIQNFVAPILFQALSTIPYLSQISYIGLDGLLFSYYTDGNQPFAIYSNSSLLIDTSTMKHTWYIQPVNRDTGKLYGEANSSQPLMTFNTSFFRESLARTNGYASLEIGWRNSQDLLFLNTVGVNGKGVISLGFPVKELVDFFYGMDFHGGSLYLATKDGKVIADGFPNTRLVVVGDSVSFELLNSNGSQIGYVGNVACKTDDGKLGASVLNIWETKYTIYCSPLDIVGVQSVYVFALPQKELESFIDKNITFAFILLLLMVGSMVLSIVVFVFLIVRAAKREMYLCAALIRQMESTQQAERKSLNKSLAFASASHDVRASLACVRGLIEVCRDEVALGSDLETNLKQMETCTKDLLGILNSILDTSKIEAGKMQLEEEELDLTQLLEDVVDLYYPVGMKKRLDVVLDPCDGSLSKFSKVKGDQTKIKQILCNLLSNAVKYTSKGHVIVRAWAKKPSFRDSIFSSSHNSSLHCISCLFLKNDEAYNGIEPINTIQENSNCVEFIFEVDDSGQGIPKEKQNSVFENYIQVKETALEQEGTGLGLGIVQSLVRLMGGEIGIVDKEIGEKGTCFRFNIFLTTCEIDSIGNAREGDIESSGGYVSSDSFQHSGPSIRAPLTSPKHEGSRVVLFIQSETRQSIMHKFMERVGIKVMTVKEWEQLPHTLKKIKQKLNLSRYSSSSRFDLSSRSEKAKDFPLNALDGTEQYPIPPVHKRTSLKGIASFILIVIDTSGGPFRELSRAVAEFKKYLYNTCYCRVIWIDKPGAQSIHSKGLDEDKLPPTDLIISKPFHGSRLYHVIGLLPEFGGTFPGISISPPEKRKQNSYQASEKLSRGNETVFVSANNFGEVQGVGSTSSEKQLSGKRVLVAEDNAVLRKLAVTSVLRFGAKVESCENGEEALELVCRALRDQKKDGASTNEVVLPYDYILMDCEMPVMDGFEATRRIREEERYYGVHIPIIALTAHTREGEEANKMMQSGMDFHLPKPLSREQLMEAIHHIH
ncbi:histidine kinase CKI1-like [Actinidia eriantha]|uniref:histidine kinase CKI1-like n=1 Tax=Actinidia eriantha TaxID=165200 RepID=UPI002587F471|nr:histidine kinase CKI1-like [Actinidia eriantha]